jgi:ComF family protein
MRQFLRTLSTFFLNPPCPLCGRSADMDFCQDCYQNLQGTRLPDPAQWWQAPLPLFGWGLYQGSLKRAIAALKYQHQPHLARPLGHWLGDSWNQWFPQKLAPLRSDLAPNHPPLKRPTPKRLITPKIRQKQHSIFRSQPKPIPIAPSKLVVVPIPIHAERLRQRGFNQAALLAQGFAQVARLPWIEHGLIRVKATEAQFGLAPEARQKNVSGAFHLGPQLQQRRDYRANHHILLLDDIYTTGSTAQSAAEVLRKAGYRVYGVAALAVAQATTSKLT